MKKYTLFFVILSSIIFVSCESKHDQLYKACQDQDFELAHQILDKMDCENDYDDMKDCLYLFEIESTYLLEQNTDEATKRVELLYGEIPDYSTNRLLDPNFDNEGKIRKKIQQTLTGLLNKANMMNNVELISFILSVNDGKIVDYDGYDGYHKLNNKIRKQAFDYLVEQGTDESLTIAVDFIISIFKDFSFKFPNDEFKAAFDKCMESGNLALTKKLIDHLDYIQQSHYISEETKAFIAIHNKKYQSAIKNKRKK